MFIIIMRAVLNKFAAKPIFPWVPCAGRI